MTKQIVTWMARSGQAVEVTIDGHSDKPIIACKIDDDLVDSMQLMDVDNVYVKKSLNHKALKDAGVLGVLVANGKTVGMIPENYDRVMAAIASLPKQLKPVDIIDGLAELQDAWRAFYRYKDAEDQARKRGYASGVLNLPSPPTVTTAEVAKKYPRAAAYVRADAWASSSNYAKSAAGSSAMRQILAGEDYKQAIADMEAAWDQHCKDHMWD